MFVNTTVKRREEEPRFFEVWQHRFLWFRVLIGSLG